MTAVKDLRRQRPLPDVDQELVARAEMAAAHAYAPYSRFFVGAAVRTGNGCIYTGANVENISYPVGTCAEAAAIAAARSAEGDAFVLAAIAIVAASESGTPQPCSPCGACRQRIVEFSETAPVIFRGAHGALICEPASASLPHRFSFHSPGS